MYGWRSRCRHCRRVSIAIENDDEMYSHDTEAHQHTEADLDVKLDLQLPADPDRIDSESKIAER